MVRSGGEEKKQPPVAEVKPDSWGKKPTDPSSDDMVTLTKSQLRAILGVIGQVSSLNINDRPAETEGENQDSRNGADHHVDLGDPRCQENGRPLSPKNDKPEAPCPLQVVVPSVSNHWASPPSNTSAEKLSPLSKVEQKRLQWEKEKAEMREWNPWGKPGAGAPTRRHQLVAPVAPRTESQLLMVQTTAAMPYANSMPGSLPSCLPSPNHYRHPSMVEQTGRDLSPTKVFPNYSYVTQPIKPVPPQLKSSIPFGPPVDGDLSSEDAFKRQRWLQDLEYQREEQRLRRLAEQEQPHAIHPVDVNWMNGYKDDSESISVPVDGFSMPGGSEVHPGGRTYARGQGFKLDPESAARAEERRRKAQEYQNAIKLQMEEKQRRVQEEKERKKRDEEEEERRLATERARIQEEYEQEQRRQKQKSEMEERKQKAMVTAVQEAQAQAEAEKKARKIHKLLPLNEDGTSKEGISSSTSVIPPAENADTPVKEDGWATRSEESVKGLQQTATVRPVQNSNMPQKDVPAPSNSKLISSRELGVQTVLVPSSHSPEHSTYTVNRVLTPSVLRVRARGGKGRDFGTQTDVNYGRWIRDDAESTESNTSCIHGPRGKKLNRVQHSKPYKVSRRVIGSDIDVNNARPKWGANQPSKSYIRMTERDPYFTKRKKMQELRKQHWERELAAQRAISNARRSTGTSYPSCRSRRNFSSSDGTGGFSSSDVDSRSFSQVRSNSPRLRNASSLRSVHGSADDIIYLDHNSSAYPGSLSTSVLKRRDSQSSDNLPSIIGGSEPGPSRLYDRVSFPESASFSGSLPPMRRKWHSQETFYPHSTLLSSTQHSPPVPTLQKRMLAIDFYRDHPPAQTRRKWSDQESFDLENVALSRSAVSRQSSSDDGSDKNDGDSCSSAGSQRQKKTQPTHGSDNKNPDPLVHPEVVTGRPTPRQDRILQQLSALRQGLLRKQKELESLIRKPPQHMS